MNIRVEYRVVVGTRKTERVAEVEYDAQSAMRVQYTERINEFDLIERSIRRIYAAMGVCEPQAAGSATDGVSGD